jgi:hypothetical protein
LFDLKNFLEKKGRGGLMAFKFTHEKVPDTSLAVYKSLGSDVPVAQLTSLAEAVLSFLCGRPLEEQLQGICEQSGMKRK